MAFQKKTIRVIIPVLNEEESIGKVLNDIPKWVDETLVVDNGSQDNTIQIARNLGATVLHEPKRGYGSACLKGIQHLDPKTDIVIFLDGDYSDYPEEMISLIEPITQSDIDMVIGSRAIGKHEKGALLPVARFGNWLSTRLIKWGWGYQFTDLGPFRSITYSALKKLKMCDPDFGWTVEMQVKAANANLKTSEVAVSYRKRIGQSKVSGTIKGSFLAGKKILWTIGKEWIKKKWP